MADASPGLSWLLPVSCAVRRARGRELGEPQAAPSLSSGSSARKMPTATGHLSPAGSWVSPLGCARSVPPPYPSSVPSHCSFSSQELREEENQLQVPLPLARAQAQVGTCTSLPCGEAHNGRTRARGAGVRHCPSPALPRPCPSSCLRSSFPPGDQEVVKWPGAAARGCVPIPPGQRVLLVPGGRCWASAGLQAELPGASRGPCGPWGQPAGGGAWLSEAGRGQWEEGGASGTGAGAVVLWAGPRLQPLLPQQCWQHCLLLLHPPHSSLQPCRALGSGSSAQRAPAAALGVTNVTCPLKPPPQRGFPEAGHQRSHPRLLGQAAAFFLTLGSALVPIFPAASAAESRGCPQQPPGDRQQS